MAAAMLFAVGAKAQTNLQTFYDLSRGHVTTTLEMFKADKWGDTFFFVDYDYNQRNSDDKVVSPSGSYFEIARALNFWQDSALGALSAHVEYNGGIGFGSQNFLFGANYFMHNADFSNTFTFELMYKTFNGSASSNVPLQFTFVWGMNNIFGVQGLNFSGFADIWGENTSYWYADPANDQADEGHFIFISEPHCGTTWATCSAARTCSWAPRWSFPTTLPATAVSIAVPAWVPSGFSNT